MANSENVVPNHRRPCDTLWQLYLHEVINQNSVIRAMKAVAKYEKRKLNQEEKAEISEIESRLSGVFIRFLLAGFNTKVWKHFNLSDTDPCN